MKREYPFLAHLPQNYRNLEMLAGMLPKDSLLRKENVLLRRTTFGAMTFGLDETTTEEIRREMCVRGIPAKRGRRWVEGILKSCPECIKTDTEKYEEPHWRRSHQPQTVSACITHRCRLNKQIKNDGRVTVLPGTPGITVPATDEEIRHARTVVAILDGLRIAPEPFKRLVYQRLSEMGLAQKSYTLKKLNRKAFRKHFEAQPGGFLEEVESKPIDWDYHLRMTGILTGGALNPTHALILTFLAGLTEEDLISGSMMPPLERPQPRRGPPRKKHEPLERKLYPCRNRLAECHLRLTATPQKRRNESARVLCSSCGYEYIIRIAELPNNTVDGIVDTTSHNPGPIWEAKFRELWVDPRIKNKELWEICGLGRSQTERQGLRLGLPKRNHEWWKAVRAGSLSLPHRAENSRYPLPSH